jgi:hypothetical protein
MPGSVTAPGAEPRQLAERSSGLGGGYFFAVDCYCRGAVLAADSI